MEKTVLHKILSFTSEDETTTAKSLLESTSSNKLKNGNPSNQSVCNELQVKDEKITPGELRIDISNFLVVNEEEVDHWRPGSLFANKMKSENLSTQISSSIKLQETDNSSISNPHTIMKSAAENIRIAKPSSKYRKNNSEDEPQNMMTSSKFRDATSSSEIGKCDSSSGPVIKKEMDENINNPPLRKADHKRNHVDNDGDDFPSGKLSQIKSVSDDCSSDSKRYKIDNSTAANFTIKQEKLKKEYKPSRCHENNNNSEQETIEGNSSSIKSSPDIRMNSSASCSQSNVADNNNSNPQAGGVLSNVVFVLSGYQNPLRNRLREKAISLGAKYRSSWTNDSTHLICAYSNTPKFKEVSGKGIVVTDKWIVDCYSTQKHLCWRDYRVKGAVSPVGKSNSSNSNESDVTAQTVTPTKDTQIDKNCVDKISQFSSIIDSLPKLPSVFRDQQFFFYGDFDETELRYFKRLVGTFGGSVRQYMSATVTIVITNCSWDSNFDEALSSNSNLRFVKSSWLNCCDKQCLFVPFGQFEIKR